ncbi:MAG: 3-deoxy-7-phosphoheptulonate synthase [Acidobacteriota bacterium]
MMGKDIPDLQIERQRWAEYADVATTHSVEVHGVRIGGSTPIIIAGPCAVESFDQTLSIARAVRDAGGHLLRGGAYKPRTSPHSFQGLGLEALRILAEIRRLTGLGIVTEVMDPRLVGQVSEHVDMLQIGSRSMQNFPLLTEVGRADRPVLLKRGWGATLEEWLCAAEYIARQGNIEIILCERGIRTPVNAGYARSILDLNIIEPLRRRTPLPVIADPSHATGRWTLVESMSRAALAAGAHGLLIEAVQEGVDRSTLRSDAEQGIPPRILAAITQAARAGRVPALRDHTALTPSA